MNIVVAIIFGLKRAPECIKVHHFEGEHAKNFLRRGFECLRHSTPPDHISGYWPAYFCYEYSLLNISFSNNLSKMPD